MNSSQTIFKYSDQIGISGSLLCLIHCFITSGVLILSTTASHMHNHSHHHGHHHHLDFWGWIDITMILVSGLAIYGATRDSSLNTRHMMWLIFSVYAASMISKYFGFEPLGLTLVSYLSSFSLIGFHLVNLWRKHKSCACDSDSKCLRPGYGSDNSKDFSKKAEKIKE